MMNSRRLFSTSTSHRNLYAQPYAGASGNPSVSPARGEIDLRAELDELFFGYDSGIRHGYPVLLREMRRNERGIRLPCTCRLEFTREPDPDCVYCDGEGYLWDEKWYWTYSMYSGADTGQASRIRYMPPASIRVDYKIFFFRYDVPLKYGDKIVEVALDTEGNVIQPLIRESIYQPQTINRQRSDNSRIEFQAVYCREDQALRLDYPTQVNE